MNVWRAGRDAVRAGRLGLALSVWCQVVLKDVKVCKNCARTGESLLIVSGLAIDSS